MRRLIPTLALVALTYNAISQSQTNMGAQANQSEASLWTERILNRDGTINWTEYERGAAHAGDLNERDYLLGPKYDYYHSRAESFPTLTSQGDADGWEGP